ncbi:MAG: HD domain-containing protein [Candidatus Zambryskibacteria bacterium]|nr:HD domain-containing protein [Candidatus Zambryskibacteria bacterium]
MNEKIKKQLYKIAEERQTKNDPLHDFQHILRVTNLAVKIGKSAKADLEIIIPAALFHDTVVYRKDDTKSKYETDESAEMAEQILKKIKGYPRGKIDKVKTCILECSFTKGIMPKLLESKVLQDADRLESTGTIAIMRGCSSSGLMNRQLYDPKDPFCKNGLEGDHSSVWLFYKRYLMIEKTIHTAFAKKIAKRRTKFLRDFLRELKLELVESDIKV